MASWRTISKAHAQLGNRFRETLFGVSPFVAFPFLDSPLNFQAFGQSLTLHRKTVPASLRSRHWLHCHVDGEGTQAKGSAHVGPVCGSLLSAVQHKLASIYRGLFSSPLTWFVFCCLFVCFPFKILSRVYTSYWETGQPNTIHPNITGSQKLNTVDFNVLTVKRLFRLPFLGESEKAYKNKLQVKVRWDEMKVRTLETCWWGYSFCWWGRTLSQCQTARKRKQTGKENVSNKRNQSKRRAKWNIKLS